jgi:WD40 repeat protein/serine/threonine protein kinase
MLFMSGQLCPSRPQLEDLIAGRFAVEQHRAVEQHVLGCATCQAAIDALDEPEDAFLAMLQGAIGPAALEGNRRFQEALARLETRCNGWSAEGTSHTPERPGPNPASVRLSDFRVIAELGRGGMGVVYEAHQFSLNRRVALKVLPVAALADPRQLERFQNEARAAASLDHPNIVPVYAVGAEQDMHYLAMRLIDGQNLAQIIDRLRRPIRSVAPDRPAESSQFGPTQGEQLDLMSLLSLDPHRDAAYCSAVARIGIQVAQALDYARERGIVHRDIKPANLMLDGTGRLWVTDFGLARIEASPSISQTGAVVGTLRCMSPEQVDYRGIVDHRSDLYSLGATLYEVLTLTPVFSDATHESLRRLIATDEPRSPRQLNRRIPADLETIILKSMSKDGGDRYATAGEFAADLRRFLEGKPIHARTIGHLRRALKWMRRRPAVAALIAVSGLVLAIVFGGGWWHAASLEVALTAGDNMRIAADEQRHAAIEQETRAREQERRVRQFRYVADMKLAFAAWKSNQVSEVLGLLARHEPDEGGDDLRTFVWHYLWALCHSELKTLSGHVDDVHCVAFSPDGRRLATASHDGTAKIWDVGSGAKIATFLEGHTGQLDTVAFSPDGNLLAVGSDDHVARLYDISSGRELFALHGHTGFVNAVAFSPNGALLASGGEDHVVKLWDPATGREQATLVGHSGAIQSLAFSPDGNTLATASADRSAILWNLAERQPRATMRGHDNQVLSVAFAHSRPILATASEDRTVKLWDATTGAEKATLRGHDRIVQCVTFSPDDRTLAAAVKDGTVWLWDVGTETVRHTIRGHVGRVWCATFSPDGRTLVTAGGDRTVKYWDPEIDSSRRVLCETAAPVAALAFSPDGRRIAAAAPARARTESCFLVCDVAEGVERSVLRRHARGFARASLSPDGRAALMIFPTLGWSGEELIQLLADDWECRDGTVHAGPDLSPLDVEAIALSPDYQTLVTAHEKTIFWDLESGSERGRLATLPGIVTAAVFSPDGRGLATGRQHGVAQIWDVATGAELAEFKGHLQAITSFAFSSDGRTLATASTDRTVRLWDRATGAPLAALQGHAGPVQAVAFSPDGKTLASGGDDLAVRLWDVATRQELVALEGHRHAVYSVAFSPDGNTLASGGAAPAGQGVIFLWPSGGDPSR